LLLLLHPQPLRPPVTGQKSSPRTERRLSRGR
jgi:hypothetical protein